MLLRNALERRRELALLRAVGYGRSALTRLVLAEHGLLLAAGLGIGVASALVAIAPAALERGAHLPVVSLTVLAVAIAAVGLVGLAGGGAPPAPHAAAGVAAVGVTRSSLNV